MDGDRSSDTSESLATLGGEGRHKAFTEVAHQAGLAQQPAKRQRKSRADPAKAVPKAEQIAADIALAAANALRLVTREGLVLVRSHDSKCGLKNVIHDGKKKTSRPWQCKVSENNVKVTLGKFTTKEEAALCYARHVGAAAAAEMDSHFEKTATMTPEAALAAAAAEGLTLRVAPGTASGYANVSCSRKKEGHRLRYCAQGVDLEAQHGAWGSKRKVLGSFDSAEEAALAVARNDCAPALLPAHAAPVERAAARRKAEKLAAREAAMKERRRSVGKARLGRIHLCSLCGEVKKGHVCRLGSSGLAATVLAASIAPTGVAAEGLLELANPNISE